MSDEIERGHAKQRLINNMRVVPAGVNAGSIQKVRNYKAWFKQAHQAVHGPRTTLASFHGLNNKYESFK